MQEAYSGVACLGRGLFVSDFVQRADGIDAVVVYDEPGGQLE